MPVHNRPLERRRLDQVLRHMCWAQIGTPSLVSELGLHIDTLLEENTL